jgi:hypothetical protein
VVFQNRKRASFRLVLVVVLLMGIYGIAPMQASAEKALEPVSAEKDCNPDGGWMWTDGPFEPEVAKQVKQELVQKGIKADVEARSYGETNSCGTYHQQGIDFTIHLADAVSTQRSSKSGFAEDVLPILTKHGKPGLGNVKLISPEGKILPTDFPNKLSTSQTLETAALTTDTLAGDPITKHVYVIVYDPLLSNNQTLSQYLGWNDQATITQQTIDFFKQATNNRMNYVVAQTTIVTSGWPQLVDGFSYTEQEYLAVLSGQQPHHEPTGVDYNKIVTSSDLDVCGKLNRGEIDEVWIYNGPWFGFYESTLVGPGAYWFNSPPVGGTHNCNRLLPIMGPSPERTVNEAVHNFGHRTESTMAKVYGSWQENNTSHSWNKFALVKAQSPNYSYSGCGSTHYPPNGTSDYDYTNSSSVSSNCDDFFNYPTLSDPLQVSQPVSCSIWGCAELNYYRYWFNHLPAFTGCGPDNVANDWWKYIEDPGYALYPPYACQSNMHWISGNAGAASAILIYTDGSVKNVITDASGNYSLLVSNHWSGTVTPSKSNYTFTPASRSYADVQSDVYSQDYTTQRGAYYVNITTGNNSNSCTSIAAPCRNIQEAINKTSDGDTIYVTSGRYLFSSNPTPNVVIMDKGLRLSGGWTSDFSAQTGASTIDGANVNNGILSISGTTIVENFIVENSTSSNSGGIYIVNGNFTLKRTTLRNNVATSNGAGIFLDNGVLTVINSTISGNRANGSGGGIYASLNSGTSVTIQNSTIAYNQASSGGGISRTNGTFNITNTIIANNISSTSGPDCSGTIAQANYNLIENMSGCSISSGGNNLNVDPQIDSNLTGVMLVHMPSASSPAIDAGTSSGCPTTDQQGTARPQGSSCDMGSIEFVGVPNTPTFTPTFTPTKTNTPTFTPTKTNTPTATQTPTFTATPFSGNNPLYLSLTSSQTIGGISTADEDILKFDGQTWSLFFDGSDVGLGSTDLFAFTILNSDTLLMSFQSTVTINGLTITPQDVVYFHATSLGSNTAGTFSMLLDGSCFGLDSSGEAIDSVSLSPDRRILLSTTGNPSVPGVSGKDEDVLVFTPALFDAYGQVLSGTWGMYFDGSDVGLADSSNEDVDALYVTSNGNIYLSTLGDFTVNGVAGADEDVFVCVPVSIGDTTSCNYLPTLYFDGSVLGLAGNDVDGINLPVNFPPATATPVLLTPSYVPPTATFTPTATNTVSAPPTNTPTWTPTAAVPPTNTPTRTNTPPATNTLTFTPTLAASSFTFLPVDDAYIASGSPTTNYGPATTLQVDNSPIKHFLIKFNVSGLNGKQVTSAKLRLYNVDPSSKGGDFYAVSDNAWQEETLTWNTAPAALTNLLGSIGSVTTGNWYEVDLTSLISGDGIYSLRISSTSSDGADYSSKEGANPPQLVVTVQ